MSDCYQMVIIEEITMRSVECKSVQRQETLKITQVTRRRRKFIDGKDATEATQIAQIPRNQDQVMIKEPKLRRLFRFKLFRSRNSRWKIQNSRKYEWWCSMLKTQKSQKIKWNETKDKNKKNVRSSWRKEKKSRTKLKKEDSGKFKMLKKVPMKESSRKLKNIEKNR